MAAYYNEIDPYAAQWLRNLISAGHIAAGDVDERSILDVRPDDLRRYTQCHFFAGIGVWSYALRRAGWADDRPVWTGSCPCQPFSAAGKGGGFDDERHLWPHFHWLISQCRPAVVLGEQVASKAVDPWIDLVHADLEAVGYAFGSVPFPSAGVGAPHIRDRSYWVAERLGQSAGGGREWLRAESTHGQLMQAGPHLSRLADDDDDGRAPGREVRPVRAEYDNEHGNTARGLGHTELVGAGRNAGTGVEAQGGPALRAERHDARSSGAIGRPGPVNGLWRDADWLFCRDGKWRPVEPRPQSMVDGTAVCLGRIGAGQIGDIELEIAEWAIRHETDPGEALHDLRRTLSAGAEREWQAGRLPDLHGAAFLLAFLRQLAEQGWSFAERASGASQEAPEAGVRVLRHLGALARAPRQPGLDGQQAGERPDALRLLSSILARHAQEAWGRAYGAHAALGFPLAHGSRERVGRLRGYGNAINAEAAIAFIESYLTYDLVER